MRNTNNTNAQVAATKFCNNFSKGAGAQDLGSFYSDANSSSEFYMRFKDVDLSGNKIAVITAAGYS